MTDQTVIVSHQFPPMPVEEFYGRNIVWNLAAFLDIPFSRVKLVDVIPEDSNLGRRRRRSTDSGNVQGAIIEIDSGDPAAGIIQ